MSEVVVGLVEVHVSNVERALIAYRRVGAEHSISLKGMRAQLIEGYWSVKFRPLKRLQRLFGAAEPTDQRKVLSYSGGDSLGFLDRAFASEWDSIKPLISECAGPDNYDCFTSWYFNHETETYKSMLSLWENTQGDTLLLSEVGCKFMNKWRVRYE